VRRGFLIGLTAAGCAPDASLEPSTIADDSITDGKGAADKAEQWASSDSPFLFSNNLETRLSALPLEGQAANIPWASSYWPVYEDTINYRWDGANSESPAAKYGRAFGVAGVEDAVSKYHGIEDNLDRKECTQSSECDSKIGEACAKRTGAAKGRCIPTWWGICHAWAPVSILQPEPKNPVTVNGVTFKVNDIKALLTLVYNSTTSKFVSLRCNRDDDSAGNITYDAYGRPTDANRECRDTNAGTYHILLANYLGIMKQSFVEDRTFDDEVWNQPLRGFKFTQVKEVNAVEANRLVGVTTAGGATANKSGTVAKGVWSHQGSFAVAAGQSVKVAMTGTGDADVYVKFGAQPTAAAYDCRPYGGTSTENCDLTAPAGATQVFVSVNGYSDSSTFNLAITTGGSVPSSYQFSANAAKFFHVKAEVKYITEASASTDGNLAATIDQYTRTDRYEYVLEVDAAGKINGGEWVGDSKKQHPDFLWLPTGVSGSSVAGGKITFAKVKELLDKSLGGATGSGQEKVVTKSGAFVKGQWKQFGPFNVGAGKTLTAKLSGVGDADLYVRKSAAPTGTQFDCRPYKSSSDESCTSTGPGAVYVSVYGYSLAGTYSLNIRYTE
jgi:hypothetical protein